MFANVTELIEQIDNWLGNRTELQPVYPSFVMLAEQRMYEALRCREMLRRASALLNEQYEFLPFDFLEVKAISASMGRGTTARQPLTGMVASQMDRNYGDLTGPLPEAFSIQGMQVRFGPAPTPQELPAQVTNPRDYRYFETFYFYRFPALDAATNPTNVILQTHPNLYLYGALIEAEPYLVNDERLPLWKMNFSESVTRLNLQAESGALSTMAMGAG